MTQSIRADASMEFSLTRMALAVPCGLERAEASPSPTKYKRPQAQVPSSFPSCRPRWGTLTAMPLSCDMSVSRTLRTTMVCMRTSFHGTHTQVASTAQLATSARQPPQFHVERSAKGGIPQEMCDTSMSETDDE